MLKEKHDELAGRDRLEEYNKEWFATALHLLNDYLPEKGKVLDIGCGNGEMADILFRKKQCEVTCLDYVQSHLDRVKDKGYEAIRCNLDCGENVEQIISQKQKQYDAVVCLEVIEHLFNPDNLLRLVYAVLKRGGVFVVSTPNMAYITYRLYSLFRGNLPSGQGHHVSFFDARRLWQQMFVCGFDVRELIHFGAGQFYLDRTIGAKGGLFRRVAIRAIYKVGLYLGPKSLRHSGLLVLGQPSEAPPLGLNRAFRNALYAKMRDEDRKLTLTRIVSKIQAGRFDEHPDLTSFCETEWNKYA